MSRRASFLVSRKTPCNGGESPNAFKPFITAELRMSWPPHTVDEFELRSALINAYLQAYRELNDRIAEGQRQPQNEWLIQP